MQLLRRLYVLSALYGLILTKINLIRNKSKQYRCLEIGPGNERISGFETLNLVSGREVDYVLDASGKLPFTDNTFDLIYASHILEHVPWYQVDNTLCEWVRILKTGGRLEIWVPDGLKICKALVDFETFGEDYISKDGWYKFNPDKEPCVWAAGRLFTYGDGKGKKDHPNWHRALFTPRYLKQLLEAVDLVALRTLEAEDVRGHDHGWINLGMVGVKK